MNVKSTIVRRSPLDFNLQIKDLHVLRGMNLVINGLSHQQQAGEIYCLTGPNGAGKSTLLRTIANRLPIADGQIFCLVPVLYVGHNDGLSASISGRDNLKGWAKINKRPHLDTNIDRALASFAATDFANVAVRLLSRGQRRRLALARLNLAPSNSLWLLDEPNAGLDEAANAALDSVVTEHASGGGMVLAATHLDFAANASPRLLILPGQTE